MKVRGMAMEDKENATRGVVGCKVGKSEQKHNWNCSFNALLTIGNAGAGFVEDEGGGASKCIEACSGGKENGQHYQQHPTSASNAYEKNCDEYLASSAACTNYEDNDNGDAAAAVNFNSNHTSRNNSTENLSFSSDNFYPEDLLFFQDDDANGAEVDNISCESDDCVYAYRGDGAELYFPMETGRAAGIADNSLDDEMDFLEMDFEPDTLSEVENGGNSVDSDLGTAVVSDALLMSGRHSSSSHILASHLRSADGGVALPIVAAQQRQLFSSPIDDTPAVPLKALQAQTLLGKNFGRMSLHLDQIKGPNECLESKVIGCEEVFDRLNGAGSVDADGGNSITSSRRHVDNVEYPTSTAHSLPNTLHTFGREKKIHEQPMVTHQTSPSKVTGAKPKRLSTFSTSSSTSSKNSSKSRTSLRSVIGPTLFNSSSFDERSVSCTEFRSGTGGATDANATSATSTTGLANPLDLNDDSCLDCLEKEFLANTIGKALEPSNCPKCRRKRFSFFRSEQQSRCRSGSPSFFSDAGHESFYELPHDYMSASTKEWLGTRGGNGQYADIGSLSLLTKRQEKLDCCMPIIALAEGGFINKAAVKCDISGEQLLTSILTEEEVVAISTSDINEEILVRTLEQLHIVYNSDLIKFYFTHHSNSPTNLSSNNSTNIQSSTKKFKDLKHFILSESKKNCNHPVLKRLIESVTNHQVDVQFKETTNKKETEMVQVSVADILRQWTRNSNLENLKDLDKRFKTANTLGKIANLIRQTQTKRTTSVRVQPDSIAIPQYYPNGFLIVRKKA